MKRETATRSEGPEKGIKGGAVVQSDACAQVAAGPADGSGASARASRRTKEKIGESHRIVVCLRPIVQLEGERERSG